MNSDPWVKEKKEVIVENAVAASAHQLASQAGIEMIQKGGNAVDAAAAVSFAIGVLEPFMSGIGGGGAINIFLNSGERITIDCYVMAPNDIGDFDWSANGHKTPCVPGTLAGWDLALELFGTMELEEVVKPATRYARNGFMIDSYVARFISDEIQRMNGAGVKLLLKDGFKTRGIGDRFVNKDLARTLELIGQEGAEAFYKGEIAEKIVEDMEKNGGLITLKDLTQYKPRIYEPAITHYRGYEIQSVPYAHGGVTVAHMLNVLEEFNPKDLAYDSTSYYHLLAETQKRIFADRLHYYGDPYYTDVPWEGLLSKEYAKELAKEIEMDKSSGAVDYGDPWRFDEGYVKPDQSLKSSYGAGVSGNGDGETTSFSVIDKERNMVATTQSNGAAFGSGVCVPGCGFFLNNFIYARGGAGFFPIPWHANYPKPHKRPLNNHSPTLVFKDDKPFMAFGSPAGRRQQGACFQTFVHVAEHGMGIQEAISAPRAHCEGNTLWMESRIPQKIRIALKDMGHDVTSMPEYTMFFGGLNGVMINPDTGKLHGGADPRRPCAAVGY